MQQQWQRVFNYFIEQGFPEDVLRYMSILECEASMIVDIIDHKKTKKILEIGTFVGLSTGVLALSSQQDCILVCVDASLPINFHSKAFGRSESGRTLDYVRKMLAYFGKSDQVVLFEGFFSYASSVHKESYISTREGYNDIVIIGDKIEKYAPYDLVFLDGDHSTEAVYSDLSLIHKYINKDCMIIAHDLGENDRWSKQVFAGISKFIQEHPEFSLKVDGRLGFLSAHL